MTRRPSHAEIAEARRYPRRHVEEWLDDEIKLGHLCERLGLSGQPAQYFREEIRRRVTDLVIEIARAMEGR